MTIKLTVIQVSNSAAQLSWTPTLPVTGNWLLLRSVDGGAPEFDVTIQNQDVRQFTDNIAAVGIGQTIEYTIADASESSQPVGFTKVDRTVPYTFGPVDPLVTAPRYTTLDTVKARLGITHGDYDPILTQAIVAAEIAMDYTLGRSFPDTGDNPQIQGVPLSISNWATDASIAVWKAADAPFGQGGGDAWLGSIDVSAITERILRRHPMALGYQISWGVA
jgi:hypothetical protein